MEGGGTPKSDESTDKLCECDSDKEGGSKQEGDGPKDERAAFIMASEFRSDFRIH